MPRDATPEQMKNIEQELSKRLDDYHVLVTKNNSESDKVTFQCFHEKDIKETDLNELRGSIMESLV